MEKVSIIIPCYNQSKYVIDAIESAAAQTYPEIEIVCINDGSTDETAEIITGIAPKFKQMLFLDQKQRRRKSKKPRHQQVNRHLHPAVGRR